MSAEDILYFIIIYGVSIGVLLHMTKTLKLAGNSLGGRGENTAQKLITGLWVWAIIANIYALLLNDNNIIWILPSLLIPMIIVIALTFTKPVIQLLKHIRLHRLVAVQFYRNLGALFLISHFVFGSYLSREFAINAGWGDVLTGMLALPVAYMVYKRISLWQIAVVLWCFIGIGDLILAPLTAQIYGGPHTDDFPMSAIPIFIGPPIGIILHLLTFRVMWLQSKSKNHAENLMQVSGGER